MLENRMVVPFADDDAQPFPEITDPADKAWILTRIDPDWRKSFRDVDAAWDAFYPLNAQEMDKLALEVADDNRKLADDRGDLGETLADICRPWLPD